ncbi:MAG TPA: hypothetical protein DEB06_11345 [Phycisphaerales bacterium]|nr:hypothetical protein [Phycisphaerales bacterium]
MQNHWLGVAALGVLICGCQSNQHASVPTDPQIAKQVNLAVERVGAQAAGDDVRFAQLIGPAIEGEWSSGARDATGHDQALLNALFESDATLASNTRNLAERTGAGERIVGGVPDTADAYRACVAVGSATGWCCTGTLVAPSVVVTAAHCVTGGCAARVFVGRDVRGPGRTIAVRSAIVHPEYRPGQNDIAVLLLAEPVNDITPIRVAAASSVESARDVRLVGYGNTDLGGTTGYGVRRLVDVPVASCCCEPQAAREYGCQPRFELVAGPPVTGRDSCTGDSGGPALVQVGIEWRLAGATSRGIPQAPANCGYGGIYSRVDQHLAWIRTVSGSNIPN